MDALPSISLVIPAYNEAAVIGRAIAEADLALRRDFADYEIVVVDDGSVDDTRQRIIEQQSYTPRLRRIRHETNRGYGAALRTGFQVAKCDLVAFTDADCQFDLRDLKRLVHNLNEVDIAVGYRVDRQDSFQRRFYSKGYNWLTRQLLPITIRDVDCALKVFPRDVIQYLLPETTGFFVNTEMLVRAHQLGLRIVEMPVTHRPRLGGESKVSLAEIPKTFRKLMSFWWNQSSVKPKPIVASWRVTNRAATPPVPAPRPASESSRQVEPLERLPASV